jgi:hypothetical protein
MLLGIKIGSLPRWRNLEKSGEIWRNLEKAALDTRLA